MADPAMPTSINPLICMTKLPANSYRHIHISCNVNHRTHYEHAATKPV